MILQNIKNIYLKKNKYLLKLYAIFLENIYVIQKESSYLVKH